MLDRVFTLSRRRFLSCRNQSIDLLCKSMDWFLYDRNLRHERVKYDSVRHIWIFLTYFMLLVSFITHSWQRGPNPLYFVKTLLYCHPLFFKFCPTPPPPLPLLSPPSPTPTDLSVVVSSCLNGWLHHIWCAILLNVIMDLHMFRLGSLIPGGPRCMFDAKRRQVYWGLTHNAVFCWNSDLISQTQTHTNKHAQHTQGPVDWHTLI